jgi:hypothetical protein
VSGPKFGLEKHLALPKLKKS